MQLVNQAEFPAELFRAQLFYRDLLMATVVVKAAFEVRNGIVVPAEEQLAVSEADIETPYGSVDGDAVPIKQGCDLAVLGHAIVPGGRAVRSMSVTVRIGGFSQQLRVLGDRAWVPAGEGHRITDPVPFNVMPLDYTRAYGGWAHHTDELGGPYPENPDGCGFVVRKTNVAGTRLPNLEDPAEPITQWQQRPTPVALIPPPRQSGLRGGRGINVDMESQRISYRPLAFNFAHPKLLLDAYPGGEQVDIEGMSESGRWRFTLPPLSFGARVRLGSREHDLALIPDTLCLLPRHQRLYVVARRALVYQFLPERERSITVFRAPEPVRDTPTSTISRERASASPSVVIEPDNPDELPLPLEELIANYPLSSIIDSLPLCASG